MVKVATPGDAFAIRAQLRACWETALMPAIERAFDEAGLGGRTIRLPRIDLGVRIATGDDIETVLAELVYNDLRDQLQAMMADQIEDHEQAGDGAMNMITNGRFDILLHYLRTGLLPWSEASIADAGTPAGLRAVAREELSRLADMLRNGAAAAGGMHEFLFRLLHLLDDDDAAIATLVYVAIGGAPNTGRDEAGRIADAIVESGRRGANRHHRLRYAATLLTEHLRGADGGAHRQRFTGLDAADETFAHDDEYQRADDAANEHAASRVAEPDADATRLLFRLLALLAEEGISGETDALLSLLPLAWRSLAPSPGAIPNDAPAAREAGLHLAARLIAGSMRAVTEPVARDAARLLSRMFASLADVDVVQFINALLEDIAPAWRTGAAEFATALNSANVTVSRAIRLRFMAALLIAGLRGGGGPVPPELRAIAGALLAPNERAALATVATTLPASAASLLEAGLAADGIARAGDAGDGDGGDAATRTRSGPEPDAREVAASTIRDLDPNSDSDSSASPHAASNSAGIADTLSDLPELIIAQAPRFSSPESELPVAVQNAGLVLLHSFIVPLFTNAGVLGADGRELPDAAVARAAALLHYLATGREDAYEFELGLCKVLLGRELEAPVLLSEGLLREGDAGEAESLLQSVIEYWSVLKKTSPESLRRTFLQRRGLLRREEQGWRLQVEPASFDMLLGQLPWGISVVKLPWMPEPIYVEWEKS